MIGLRPSAQVPALCARMVRLTQLSLCNNQIQASLNDRPPPSYQPPDRTNTRSYAGRARAQHCNQPRQSARQCVAGAVGADHPTADLHHPCAAHALARFEPDRGGEPCCALALSFARWLSSGRAVQPWRPTDGIQKPFNPTQPNPMPVGTPGVAIRGDCPALSEIRPIRLVSVRAAD